MITVTVQKLNRTGRDLSDEIVEVPAANAIAEKAAENIEARVKHLDCDAHLGHPNVLVVRAVSSSHFDIDKSQFCCDDLRNRVVINVTKTA